MCGNDWHLFVGEGARVDLDLIDHPGEVLVVRSCPGLHSSGEAAKGQRQSMKGQ